MNMSCPHCEKHMNNSPTLAGRRIQCPYCRQPFLAPQLEDRDTTGIALPSTFHVSPTVRWIAFSCLSVVLAACWLTDRHFRHQAKTAPYYQAAASYARDNREVIKRVGTPVSVRVVQCHFGLKDKDPELFELLDRFERNTANALVWVDCLATGPKGELRVALWLLKKKKKNEMKLLFTWVGIAPDRGTMRELLEQFTGEEQ